MTFIATIYKYSIIYAIEMKIFAIGLLYCNFFSWIW